MFGYRAAADDAKADRPPFVNGRIRHVNPHLSLLLIAVYFWFLPAGSCVAAPKCGM